MILFAKIVNLVYDKGGLMGEWTKPLFTMIIFLLANFTITLWFYDYYR